jgi:hypothetical protein
MDRPVGFARIVKKINGKNRFRKKFPTKKRRAGRKKVMLLPPAALLHCHTIPLRRETDVPSKLKKFQGRASIIPGCRAHREMRQMFSILPTTIPRAEKGPGRACDTR